MTTEEKIIKNKLGLLRLAEQLGNISQACEVERAIELYALASQYPLMSNCRWFDDIAGKHIAVAAATLPSEVAQAAQKRGESLDLWETADELVLE